MSHSKPENADTLFPSDEDEEHRHQQDKKSKKRKAHEPSMPVIEPGPRREHSSRPPASKKPYFKPIPSPAPTHLPTASETFGDISDDEAPAPPASNGNDAPIVSYITRRLANGRSKQVFENKPGTHYIDLKVYKCDEIQKLKPMNRWQHAVITLKNRTDDNSEAWQHLANFVIASRKEFRHIPPTFTSFYNNY